MGCLLYQMITNSNLFNLEFNEDNTINDYIHYRMIVEEIEEIPTHIWNKMNYLHIHLKSQYTLKYGNKDGPFSDSKMKKLEYIQL